MSTVPPVDYERKYKQAKRMIYNIEKTSRETARDKDVKIDRLTRSLDALRSAIDFARTGQSKLTKEDIINQMQTELPSDDDEKEESYDDANPKS
jgi:hypothetical protein